MLDELEIHNQFIESIERFKTHDPHLKRLENIPLVFQSDLLGETTFYNPGVYLITGGRQIGKTTFLKQFILNLLTQKQVNPKGIYFISGEIIDTHHILRRIINRFHDDSLPHQYLFIDEVNYIPDWDKSIKYLADSGILEKMSVILTGSDNQIIRTAMKRFAGRRGASDKVDFDFFPLSFSEFVSLKQPELEALCQQTAETPLTTELPIYDKHHKTVTELFYQYLLHGGYLPAINDLNVSGTISKGIMNTYIHWIIGDILKYNKSENYLFEILKGIQTTYNSQVSWNSLGKHLSIEHHKTVSDYCNLLVSIHALHIQEAIIEHKLIGAPKKSRKIFFRDPFVHHAVSAYLDPDFSIDQTASNLRDNKFASAYVEAVAVDHCKRWLPTYYIKGNKGEVDIAVVKDKKMIPVEVKWTGRIRPEDIRQVQNYDNGILLSPKPGINRINNTVLVPLVRFLIHTGARRFTP